MAFIALDRRYVQINNYFLFLHENQGPVVQNIVSLMSWFMTNSLTVVAKVYSYTLIFLGEKKM